MSGCSLDLLSNANCLYFLIPLGLEAAGDLSAGINAIPMALLEFCRGEGAIFINCILYVEFSGLRDDMGCWFRVVV